MAKLIGGLGTSHVPSIAAAIDKGLRDTPDWKPFFDGYIPGQDWVREHKPDVAVVIFNDHGNSFFLDKVPTFAVGCAEEYRPIDEGWGPRAIPPFKGAVDFSWHFIDTLVENRFDPMICQEIEVDHGIQVPMELFWGRPEEWPVRVVPIFVNVIQYPIPLPSRCYEMGRVLRQAIESYPGDE
ncbi:MAG: protocatechuate 3,4-dioxygenase, partial [Pseudomonadota bacterium]|nr:protocatechuate 3,4-dioxygenase [Pseudomonadota bacterium]